MSMLEWNDSLAVNVAAMDAQHRQLVDMINTLHDAMKQDVEEDMLSTTLEDLGRYAREHFGMEEGFMEQYRYPDAAAHKEEHKGFMEKVEQMHAECAAGKAALSMDVLNFLSSWLVKHINGTDKKLGAFLQQQGAA